MNVRGTVILVVAASVVAAACGTAGVEGADSPGVRLVPVTEASGLLAEPDRIVIDVRTPAEFADGHLAGARMIDIQSSTFADDIGQLDPKASYLVYCRTANRSAGARQLMSELGFRDVADIEGGVVAWTAAGLPLDR